MEASGRIHSFESFGTLDGPGIRYVVFMQGCALRCRYCHNPDTWDPQGGRLMTVSEIMKQIESCRNYIRSGGVTLSGGEPLRQPEFALALLESCRQSGFHTAVDTAGSVPLEISRPVIDAADMLLLDIKAQDPELCRKLTGYDNSHELASLDYCEKTGKTVWIRHVLVPGWTLDFERLKKLAAFLKPYQCIKRIDLLPFHKMASFKWEKLGLKDPFESVQEPDKEDIRKAEELFR